MASALGEARLLDVTLSPAAAQVFSREDLVVFGAPVYGGRVFCRGFRAPLPPCGGQGPPASSLSPTATGTLTTPSWS